MLGVLEGVLECHLYYSGGFRSVNLKPTVYFWNERTKATPRGKTLAKSTLTQVKLTKLQVFTSTLNSVYIKVKFLRQNTR